MPVLPALIAAFLPIAADTLPDRAAFTIPETAVRQVMDDPQKYFEEMTDLIAGYGADGAITAEQVDTSIAFEQAKARSYVMSVLAGGDLNCDGVLTGDELRRTKAALGASARARLQRIFVQADADGDGKVSASEVMDFGLIAADKAVTPTEIKTTKLMMAFDANEDGKVTVEEVREGLSF